MTIQTFIEKAIEGGWEEGMGMDMKRVEYIKGTSTVRVFHFDSSEYNAYTLHEILLDPLAWQAVGKVEGWGHKSIPQSFEDSDPEDSILDWDSQEEWLYNMHRMIDALAEGKTIEEFLQSL